MRIVVAALALCSVPTAGAAEADVAVDLALAGTERGVCASDFQGAALASYVRPEVCVRNGTPRKPGDDRGWLFVVVETDGKHDADVRAWIVTVKSGDGKVVLERRLARESVEKGPCSIEGCHATFAALRTPPWRRGTYRFHLAYVEEADIAADLSITLK